jgi:hypothetical protein
MLQPGRSPVRISDEVDIFNLPKPSSRTVALGSTQPLTEMSTRNLPGGNKRPAWEPQPLVTLRASTACTGITLPYLTLPHCLSSLRHAVLDHDSETFGKSAIFRIFEVGNILLWLLLIES